LSFPDSPQQVPTAAHVSVVIPVFNEAQTLEACVNRLLTVLAPVYPLEIILVDDGSQDGSVSIAQRLSASHPQTVRLLRHEVNQGKGAALHTGFAAARGDFVAIQDADMEYDPADIPRLLEPLLQGKADVVLGSRFLTTHSRRVMYFWHRQINRTLTVLSNMLTDLDLTDMETCYKVFRRDLLQSLDLKEKRFGFEPEVVAKMAQKRVRVYEIGISYHARTFSEGKKIRAKDGFRALWCILKYNLPRASFLLQFFFYLVVGGVSALANLAAFWLLFNLSVSPGASAATAFSIAAMVNYLLSVTFVFRSRAKWSGKWEIALYLALVMAIGLVDCGLTVWLVDLDHHPLVAKAAATVACIGLNFLGRKYLVFYERGNPDWLPR
jgi:dolichol-phosphate mannosyltransferase